MDARAPVSSTSGLGALRPAAASALQARPGPTAVKGVSANDRLAILVPTEATKVGALDCPLPYFARAPFVARATRRSRAAEWHLSGLRTNSSASSLCRHGSLRA